MPSDNTLTLDTFIAWLETMPVEGEYEFYSYSACVVGQFVTAVTGSDNPFFETNYASIFGGLEPYREVCASEPQTFGAALQRAKAMRG